MSFFFSFSIFYKIVDYLYQDFFYKFVTREKLRLEEKKKSLENEEKKVIVGL